MKHLSNIKLFPLILLKATVTSDQPNWGNFKASRRIPRLKIHGQQGGREHKSPFLLSFDLLSVILVLSYASGKQVSFITYKACLILKQSQESELCSILRSCWSFRDFSFFFLLIS